MIATDINLLPSTGLNVKNGKTNVRSLDTLGSNRNTIYAMDEKTGM